jgi:uncharacterized protein (TIGR00297 family)
VIGYSEPTRQLVHIVMGGFALLLRVFTWQQAAMLACSACIFNLIALPRLAPRIVRRGELRSARAGVLFYPLSVLFLVLSFPGRLDIVAAAWGIMAFGDGSATLAGTRLGGRRLPWNTAKTWSGLVAFLSVGGTASVALSLWVAPAVTPEPSLVFSICAPLVATVVAGLVETLPIGLDDNISVPAAAGATLWFAGQMNRPGALGGFAIDALTGAAISLPFALMTIRARRVSTGGAAAGTCIAGIAYAGMYLGGLIVLGVALALTLGSSRVARRRQAGTAVEVSERRAVGNVIANCLIGTLGAAAERFSSDWTLALTATWFVAGIAAGASDTVASEIGRRFGGVPRSFPTWRRVAPGASGGVTIVGTVAGAAAAAVIAAPAALMWLLPWATVPVVVAACTIASLVESALATAFEASGILDNNALNVLNTAVAASLAVVWMPASA